MSKIPTAFLFITLTIFSGGCDGPKKSSENQGASSEKTLTVDSPAVRVHTKEDSAARSHNKDGQSITVTGAQVIENTVSRAASKLKLSESQVVQLKEILTTTFTAKGEDLAKSYSIEQSRVIGRDLIKQSSESIMQILDANQQQQFKNLHQR